MAINPMSHDQIGTELLGASSRGSLHVIAADLRDRLERDVTARLAGLLVVSGLLVLATLALVRVSIDVSLSAVAILIPATFFLIRISDVFVDPSMRRAKQYLWLVREEKTKPQRVHIASVPVEVDRLLVQQYYLQVFDKLERKLCDVVTESIGEFSESMSLRDVVRYASDSGLWSEGDLQCWSEALAVRRGILDSIRREPSLTSLTVAAGRLRRLYWSLDDSKRGIIDSTPALSVIDDQMASRAAECLS